MTMIMIRVHHIMHIVQHRKGIMLIFICACVENGILCRFVDEQPRNISIDIRWIRFLSELNLNSSRIPWLLLHIDSSSVVKAERADL